MKGATQQSARSAIMFKHLTKKTLIGARHPSKCLQSTLSVNIKRNYQQHILALCEQVYVIANTIIHIAKVMHSSLLHAIGYKIGKNETCYMQIVSLGDVT